MPNIVLNGTEYYFAHKNGGTTVRMWAKQYETGLGAKLRTSGAYYDLTPFGLPKMWMDNSLREPRGFQPTDSTAEKWCIKRDPLDRFVSAYADKILRERLVSWTIDDVIELLSSGRVHDVIRARAEGWQAALHFLPQCFWLGTSKSYYNCVFDLTEMSEVKRHCEDKVFKIRLEDFHARNFASTSIMKPKLTTSQRKELTNLYQRDYDVGWF